MKIRIAVSSLLVSTLVLAMFASTARSAPEADAEDEESGLVLVNAAQQLGDVGKIEKLRKVLDSRGMLHKLPRHLEAALDGRAVQVGDIDAIKEAVSNQEYDAALKVIDNNERRLIESTSGGDPLPALSELAEWRGHIAVAKNDEEGAVEWFRAAHRFNSARTVEKPSPRVRRLLKRAYKEPAEIGKLRVMLDGANPEVRVDGGKALPAGKRIELPVGYHLVTITADGRTSYSELVQIKEGETEKLAIELDSESSDDKAAKLVDATVSAAPGKARLRKATKLSSVTGTKRYLMIEDGGDDRVTVRLYDVSTKKVSKPVDLLDTASSATIMRLVNAALDPENMIDATQVTVIQTERSQRWYERWYVWVGVGAVIGGGVLTYEYMSREPTAVRF